MQPDLDRTLEQIDGKHWGTPTYESRLVITCHQLRKKMLRDFSIEDLRIMIGQNFNLRELIPLALQRLDVDLMAEGAYYPGDLLQNVLHCDPSYWLAHQDQWLHLRNHIAASLAAPPGLSLDKRLQRSYNQFCALFPGSS